MTSELLVSIGSGYNSEITPSIDQGEYARERLVREEEIGKIVFKQAKRLRNRGIH